MGQRRDSDKMLRGLKRGGRPCQRGLQGRVPQEDAIVVVAKEWASSRGDPARQKESVWVTAPTTLDVCLIQITLEALSGEIRLCIKQTWR